MKNNKFTMTLCLLVLFCSMFSTAFAVLAAESSGGQVSTTTKMTFYEGDKKPDPKPDPKPNPKPKPGVLPQTGEATSNFGIAGLIVLLLVGAVVILKRNKEAKR